MVENVEDMDAYHLIFCLSYDSTKNAVKKLFIKSRDKKLYFTEIYFLTVFMRSFQSQVICCMLLPGTKTLQSSNFYSYFRICMFYEDECYIYFFIDDVFFTHFLFSLFLTTSNVSCLCLLFAFVKKNFQHFLLLAL